jgi:hypothetical protein
LQTIEAFHQRCPENPKPAAETLAEPEAGAKKRSPRRGGMLESLGVTIVRGRTIMEVIFTGSRIFQKPLHLPKTSFNPVFALCVT